MTVSRKDILQTLKSLFLADARDNFPLKILVGLSLIIVVSLLFPHPESIDYSYNVGSVWTDKDLIAQFSFPVFKDLHDYEKERQEAVRNVYPVFERHDEITRAVVDSIADILSLLQDAVVVRAHPETPRMRRVADSLPFSLTDGERDLLHQWLAGESHGGGKLRLEEFQKLLTLIISDILRNGVIDQLKLKQSRADVVLRKGTEEVIMPYAKLYDLDEALSVATGQVSAVLKDGAGVSIASKIIRAIMRPNILFNQDETQHAIQRSEDNVPRTIGYVQENERIISKHDQITEEKKLKLESYRKARIDRGPQYIEWRHRIGIVAHVTIVLGLFAIYLFLFRKRIIHDNGQLVLISIIILLEAFLTYLSLVLNLTEPVQYLIFVPAASMLLAIIFDSRVAFYGTVVIALLIAGIRGNDYAFALTSMVAGALGAYTVRDIRNRTQIFRSIVFIFIGYVVPIVALSLEQFDSLTTITSALTFALANAVFSPVLTYGLLIFFERVFTVTTDLTLLELSDFNQPLLRLLSEKAPGTFQHSIVIGNMAEAAAEAIRANSILARVGGYYHDIGKTLKPEYFVENQVGSGNRHQRLRPRMSALIIQSHVKEGVELGREHRLPEKILDFIPQHHGTTRISFFYDKALKAAARRPGKETINEEDFRYPGPKPQTRETAIVMLADSVEASTRAIDEMTPQKLEQAIENMIRQRFTEGQLDECVLTLRDLAKITDAFTKILIGIHHQRIKYPGQQQEEVPPKRIPAAEIVPAVEGTSPKTTEDSPPALHSNVRVQPPADASPQLNPAQPASPDALDESKQSGNGEGDVQPHHTDQQQ